MPKKVGTKKKVKTTTKTKIINRNKNTNINNVHVHVEKPKPRKKRVSKPKEDVPKNNLITLKEKPSLNVFIAVSSTGAFATGVVVDKTDSSLIILYINISLQILHLHLNFSFFNFNFLKKHWSLIA